MKKRFCAILAVLVLALLFSCPVVAKGRTVRSSDRRFEVEVPKKWSDMSGKLDPSGGTDQFYMIEAGADKSQAYIVFKEEDLDRVVLKTFDDYFNALSSGIACPVLRTRSWMDAACFAGNVHFPRHGSRMTAKLRRVLPAGSMRFREERAPATSFSDGQSPEMHSIWDPCLTPSSIRSGYLPEEQRFRATGNTQHSGSGALNRTLAHDAQ